MIPRILVLFKRRSAEKGALGRNLLVSENLSQWVEFGVQIAWEYLRTLGRVRRCGGSRSFFISDDRKDGPARPA
jgi:hypothetical protein